MTNFTVIQGMPPNFTTVQEGLVQSYEKARLALQLLRAMHDGGQSDEAEVQAINKFMSTLSDQQQVGVQKLLIAVGSGTDEGWQLAVKWARSVYGDEATDLALKSLKY